jgi:hypothetical protein
MPMVHYGTKDEPGFELEQSRSENVGGDMFSYTDPMGDLFARTPPALT